PGSCRDCDNRGKIQELEFLPNLAFEIGGHRWRLGHQVPLIDHDDDRAARFVGVTGDMRVGGGNPGLAVDHQDGNVAPFEVPACHDHAQLFSFQLGAALAANAGGVDETKAATGVLDNAVDGIAG